MSRLAVHNFGLTGPEAPTLLLLHGYSDSGTNWSDAVAHWQHRYRIVAPDALGHGSSPRYTDAELAADPSVAMYDTTIEVLEQLVAEGSRVAVVGHSMGGRMAGVIAGRRPDLVVAAVLEDPAWISGEVTGGSVEAFTAAERQRWEDERDLRLAEARASGWPETELEAWLDAKRDLDKRFGARGQLVSPEPWQAEVKTLSVPTLIVTGDRDVILDDDLLPEVRSLVPTGTEIAVIPDAGHGVRRENPAGYYAAVDAFLDAFLAARFD